MQGVELCDTNFENLCSFEGKKMSSTPRREAHPYTMKLFPFRTCLIGKEIEIQPGKRFQFGSLYRDSEVKLRPRCTLKQNFRRY